MQYQFRNLLTCFLLIGLLTACKPITLPPDVTPTAASEETAADENDIPPITVVKIPTFSDSVQQEVMEAELELFYAADFTHDVPTAERMFADDFEETGTYGGVIHKQRKVSDIRNNPSHPKSAEFTDVEIVVNGDTATAHFVLNVTNLYDSTSTQTYTNVWMKRDGQWQLVTSKWEF